MKNSAFSMRKIVFIVTLTLTVALSLGLGLGLTSYFRSKINPSVAEPTADNIFTTAWKDSFNNANVGLTYNQITEICFENSAPSGYTDTGATYGSIKIYKSGTKIAFVYSSIVLQARQENLFSGLYALTRISFNAFDTSNMGTTKGMFNGSMNLKQLD